MTEARVAIICVDDWTILYIDGKKVQEGHSIDVRNVFGAAGIPLDHRWLDGTEFEAWLGEGNLGPENLKDVPHA